jgi:hypothetical protein
MKRLPLSKAEPIFSVWPWNKGVNSVNCYDYAIGDFEDYRNVKSTPGNRAKISSNGMNFTTCRGIKKRILSDNPGTVYQCKNSNRVCRRGFYKIMNFVSPQGDFHFYKQIKGIKYRVKVGDTPTSLAKVFRVSKTIFTKRLVPGKVITIPVNLWAHKQGWGALPLYTDAKGKTIVDPRKAARNYPGLNYSIFCGTYCVKKNKAGSGARSSPGIKNLK